MSIPVTQNIFEKLSVQSEDSCNRAVGSAVGEYRPIKFIYCILKMLLYDSSDCQLNLRFQT